MVKRKNLNKSISSSVKRYIDYIATKGINVEKTIIFGSYVHGKPTDDSDIDLCLISKNFGRDEIGELQMLLRCARHVDDRIEPVPFTPGDFENSANPLVAQIKKYGQII